MAKFSFIYDYIYHKIRYLAHFGDTAASGIYYDIIGYRSSLKCKSISNSKYQK